MQSRASGGAVIGGIQENVSLRHRGLLAYLQLFFPNSNSTPLIHPCHASANSSFSVPIFCSRACCCCGECGVHFPRRHSGCYPDMVPILGLRRPAHLPEKRPPARRTLCTRNLEAFNSALSGLCLRYVCTTYCVDDWIDQTRTDQDAVLAAGIVSGCTSTLDHASTRYQLSVPPGTQAHCAFRGASRGTPSASRLLSSSWDR